MNDSPCLALPRRTLFALWDGDFAALSRLLRCVKRSADGGGGPALGQVVVVVRMPGATPATWVATASQAAPLVRGAGACLGLNIGGPERGEPLDALLRRAAHVGFDWLQLPERAEPLALAARPPSRVLRSCHDLTGLEAAFVAGADACTLSPIWPTASKVGHPGLGRAMLTQACARWPGAIVALGGVDAARAHAAFALGAGGIAGLSAPWAAEASALIAALLDR